MNVVELTRALVDIESVTENEVGVGAFLHDYLAQTCCAHRRARGADGSRAAAASTYWRAGASPVVTLSTHMDTVPPFFPSREDAEFIWGRGACDAKGIIAAMIWRGRKTAGRGREEFRAAVCGGRGAQQRGRGRGGARAARLAVPDQRRTDGKQAGAGVEGRAAV